MIITCPNCEWQLTENVHFCANCGQKVKIERYNVSVVLHEIFHAFTHTDKGILFLLKELSVRPGKVLREFIIEGKRKRYFNPFTFLIVVAGLAFLSTIWFKPYSATSQQNYSNAKPTTTPINPKTREAFMERSKKLSLFMETNTKLLIFASVPISALIFLAFYRKAGLNYMEHFVANVFLQGYFSIIMILYSPLQAFLKTKGVYAILLTFILLFIQLIYQGWAYQGFMHPHHTFKIKPFIASLVNIIVWVFITGFSSYLYLAGVFN